MAKNQVNASTLLKASEKVLEHHEKASGNKTVTQQSTTFPSSDPEQRCHVLIANKKISNYERCRTTKTHKVSMDDKDIRRFKAKSSVRNGMTSTRILNIPYPKMQYSVSSVPCFIKDRT